MESCNQTRNFNVILSHNTMNENKLSLARKRSEDPAQEHLRQQKDIWNQAAKSLITKMIAFKRGINGRGDPREGLPPSKIENPLPSEISQYLDHMANEYTSLLDGAYSIIEEQNNYSQVRKQHLPAAADDGMISEASWAGSRFWASLFGIKGKGKEHIIQMLNSTNQIHKSLENLENVLTSSDHNSISTSINEAGALGLSSVKSLLSSFKKLEYIRRKEEEKNESNTITKPEQTIAPVIAPAEQKTDLKEVVKGLPEEERNNYTDIESSNNYYDIYDELLEDIKFSKLVINLAIGFVKDKTYDISEKDKYLRILNDGLKFKSYIFKLDKLVNAAKENIEDESIVDTAVQSIKKFITLYLAVAECCSNILNIKLTDQVNVYSKFRILSDESKKQSKTASVKSYLKTKWMKFVNNIVSDKIEGVKLQCLDSIVTTLDKANILMNSLESPGASTIVIKNNIISLLRSLIYFNVLLITLAKLHNTEREQEIINKKKKNVTLYEIKMSSIRKVEDSISYMREFIKDYE